MSDRSESIENRRRKSYTRELADGLKLEAEVGLCVFMHPGYPLQVTITLRRNNGEFLGKAYAVDRSKDAQTYTAADVEALLAGVRIAPCPQCTAPAFDQETTQTNLSGLCEACARSDLEAVVARIEEAERKEIADRDRRMKSQGMRVRVRAWVHSASGGDDYCLDWYLEAPPTPEQVKRYLLERHSRVVDDYEIITL